MKYIKTFMLIIIFLHIGLIIDKNMECGKKTSEKNRPITLTNIYILLTKK